MPVILAIECSTGPVSVAVHNGNKPLIYKEEFAHSKQSSVLVPLIEQALKECRLSYKDLQVVACTIGPGSFTGIRIGLATARGICLAGNVQGMGFTTLDVLAHAARKPGRAVLAVLNAGKGEHYYQGFDALGQPLCMPSLGTLETATRWMPHGFIMATGTPRADTLAALAASAEYAAALQPFYIRPPDAIPLKPSQSAV